MKLARAQMIKIDLSSILNLKIYVIIKKRLFKRSLKGGRPGSLTKLQRAMGHSSLQVSLTYLRGLEVTELTEEDMPMV